MDLAALATLAPDPLRALLPQFLSGYIRDPAAARTNLARMAGLVSDWDDATCARVLGRLSSLGDAQQVYFADPACRVLSRVWSQDVILHPAVEGTHHLRAAMEAGPTLILCNHLSYFDSNAIDAVLAWAGHEDLADRLVSAAGPKVYQALFRRVAAACLNTLPVPQSTSFTHTEPLSARELARRALASLDAARQVTAEGYVLLIYPEGSRSRSGRMGPFLKAVHRYLQSSDRLAVVPAAIEGTHRLMPVDDEHMYPRSISLRFGAPLQVGGALSARDALERAHQTIADLLPEAHHPAPEAPAVA